MAATEDRVPFELLDVDNYATWAKRMKYLLIMKGLWSAVTSDTVDADKNEKAMAAIGLRMKDHHLATLERCTTAKQVWMELAATFQAKSNARKRQLRKELSQLKMGTAEPLTKYVSRAKEIQNQLRAAGHEVSDQEVAWAVLAGLPPAFDTVVTVLESSTDADLKLEDLLPKLMPVEQRMTQESSSHSSLLGETALAAKRKSGYDGRPKRYEGHKQRLCFACGRPGHIAKNCPERRDRLHYGRREPHYTATIAL